MHSKQKSSKRRPYCFLSLYKKQKDEKLLRNAASRNDTERVTELLASGVNPNTWDERGRTALHLASASGYSNVVKILLSHQADCNIIDKLGNTPLHLAVCTTSTATINLLLNAGCSAFQKAHTGCTPLQLAQTKLYLLQKYCSPEYSEIKNKISEIIKTMKNLAQHKSQEKKLAMLFSSSLLLNENSDLASDVNNLHEKLKNLEL